MLVRGKRAAADSINIAQSCQYKNKRYSIYIA